MPVQQSPSLHIGMYEDIIVGEANNLYGRLLKHPTNDIMDNAASKMSISPLTSNFTSHRNGSDTYIKENTELYHIIKKIFLIAK